MSERCIAGDRGSPSSPSHAAHTYAACNGNGPTPAALLGRLPGSEPGCPVLEHDSLHSTTSEAPSGSSEDRAIRMNGFSHAAGPEDTASMQECTQETIMTASLGCSQVAGSRPLSPCRVRACMLFMIQVVGVKQG